MTPNQIKDYYIVYFDILGYKDFFKEQPDKVPELLNSIHDAIRRAKNHIGIANASPLLHGVAGIDIYAKIFSDNILLCMETSETQHEQLRLLQFMPAKVRKPRWKPNVEGHVKIVTMHILLF